MTLALVVLLSMGVERAEKPFADFAQAATVTGVTQPGLYRIELDDTIWRQSRGARPLADVRLAGPDDRELPLLVRPVPVELPPQPTIRSVDVRGTAEGGAVITLDLGDQPPSHDEVRLSAGPGDFVRPVRVESSNDGQRWRVIASGGIVYQLGTAPPPNARLAVSHPPDRARFVRVTVGAGPTPAVFTGATAAALPPVAPQLHACELEVARTETDPEVHITRAWLDEKEQRDEVALPVEAVAFDVPATAGFSRRAVVSADVGGRWQAIGSGMLYRPDARAAIGGTQESLRIAIQPVRTRQLMVELADDSSPLAIARGFAEWRARELVFRADRAGPHTLYVGSAGAAPPPALARIDGPLTDAHLSPLEPNPRFGVVARKELTPMHGHHLRRWLSLTTLLLVVIAAMVWRARRRPTAGSSVKPRLA